MEDKYMLIGGVIFYTAGLSKQQLNDLRYVQEQFKKLNQKAKREYIDPSVLKGLNLKDIYDKYNMHFIKGSAIDKDILIDVVRQPKKGGKFEYYARQIDFINLLEKLGINRNEVKYE